MGDPLFLQMKQHNSVAGVVGRVKSPPSPLAQHQVLLSRVTDTGKSCVISPSSGFTDFVRLLSGLRRHYSGRRIVFVDLYGVPQFEHMRFAQFVAKSRCLCNWSQRRPFRDEQFNQLANYVFGHCDALILRESVSL